MAAGQPSNEPRDVEARIVAAAVALAAEVGWQNVRLHVLAERTGLALPVIGAPFPDVDVIVDAWFAAARLHLLATPWPSTADQANIADQPSIADQPADRRLAAVIGRWLEFFGSDRQVAIDAIRAELHPSHPHHWVLLVLDLSRLVHDFLDVARVPGQPLLRPAQEIALTGITLAMRRDWGRDLSLDATTTKRRPRLHLGCAGALARRCRCQT